MITIIKYHFPYFGPSNGDGVSIAWQLSWRKHNNTLANYVIYAMKPLLIGL